MIAIIDYGAGNLHSVQNALKILGAESVVTGDADTILAADKIILPGVGAFGDSKAALAQADLCETVKSVIAAGKPFLGICLGMQLLFDSSEESPGVEGLSVFRGSFKKIPKVDDIKIPHIGWNSLEIPKDSKILKNIGENPYVYFVHSYYLEPENPADVSAYTTYGTKFAVAAERDNVFAVQFHPEKSGDTGLKILENFVNL